MKPLDALKAVGNAGKEAFVNVGDAIANTSRDALRAREARAKSPAFQAEMAQENAEFGKVLGNLAGNTFDAGVGIVLKTPYKFLTNSLRLLYDKKYHGKDFGKDTLGLFLGKDGVAHNALKVTANAVHLGAKGAKIGVRQLFAK